MGRSQDLVLSYDVSYATQLLSNAELDMEFGANQIRVWGSGALRSRL